MKKIDYNKILYLIGVIFFTLFCIFAIRDYINYGGVNTVVSFYLIITKRILQFMLPGIIFIYMYNQNTYIKESKYIVKCNKINKNSTFKIAHISDFHNTNSKRIKRGIIQKLKENNPNIIIITGDLIDSRRTNISTVKEFVKSIINIAPVYYVLGNHESRLHNVKELEQIIQNSGATILRNKVMDLTENIQLIGLDDPAFFVNIEQKIQGMMPKIIDLKLSRLAHQNNKFKILLTHRPELIDVYSNNEIDLVFTGHAHGGQIRLPIVGGIFAPGQGIFPKYTKGMYTIKDTKLVVSRGIGNSKFPFRINNRPELVFVTLE